MISRSRWFAASAVVALLSSACSFKNDVPATVEVRCSTGQACPAGLACSPVLERCVPESDFHAPALQILAAQVMPARGSASTAFALSFSITRALAATPVATAHGFDPATGAPVAFPFACGACAPTTGCTCSLAFSASPAPPEGSYAVQISATDDVGNSTGAVNGGSFVLDLTPPALLEPATLALIPGPAVVTPLEQLGPLGSAEICFRVTEALGAEPVLHSNPVGLSLAEEAGYPTPDQRYCFTADLDGGAPPDGPAEIDADLVDLVGNAATVPLLGLSDGGLVLKSTPPTLLDLSTDAGLYQHRAPWGEPPTIGSPIDELRSAGAAVPEVGYLRVYSDATGTQLVAQLRVEPGALAPSLSLGATDLARVWAELVDLAGNRGPAGPQAVVHGEWVATLGNKVAGDTALNPHRCSGRPVDTGLLTQLDDPLYELDGTRGPTGAPGATVTGAGSWKRRAPNTITGPSDVPGFAVDEARQRLVVAFTGGESTQTNEWDGRDLSLVSDSSTSGPTARGSPGVAYDSQRGEMVIFGGDDEESGGTLCDTWSWNGSRWLAGPTCAFPPFPDGGGVPSSRMSPTAAYDPVRRQVVLLGGSDAFGNFALDQWAFDGTAWHPLPALGSALPPLNGASASYLPLSASDGVLVLVGGNYPATDGGNEVGTNETWVGAWQDGGYAWSQLSGDTVCPPPEGQLDCGATLMVRSGGLDAYDGNWWSLQGLDGGWYERRDLSSDPGAEIDYLDAVWVVPGSNPARLQLIGESQIVECGEDTACGVLHVDAGPLPEARDIASLAFDDQGRAVVFGGTAGPSDEEISDPRLWNGNDWSPLAAGPVARSTAGLTYDPEGGRFVLVGGSLHMADLVDSWALDLDGGAWTELDATALHPPGLSSRGLAPTPDAGLVLFGAAARVYRVFDAPSEPAVAIGPALSSLGFGAYDSRRNTLVVAENGSDSIQELTLGTGAWRTRVTSGVPSYGPVVYDSARGETLFIMGLLFGQPSSVTAWSWDGTTFAALPVAAPFGEVPQARENTTAAYDPSTQTSLLFSGDNGGTFLEDTWELSMAGNRPALTCLFDTTAARLPVGSSVDGLTVASLASGSGGATLGLWLQDAFAPLAQCGPGAGSDCSLDATALGYAGLAPPGVMDNLGVIAVQVKPQSPNGEGQAQVAVTSMAVTLSYRLP